MHNNSSSLPAANAYKNGSSALDILQIASIEKKEVVSEVYLENLSTYSQHNLYRLLLLCIIFRII